jgi:glycogen debranching enzyme
MDEQKLASAAEKVLSKNDRGDWTCPSADLYPHQWLWDSCFTAIGLRHLQIERAQAEIRSLLIGQWKNGMVPNIIFAANNRYHAGPYLWNAAASPNYPAGVETTGISQPPMLAEAVVRIGRMLPKDRRLAWYREVYAPLANFHEWLYKNRDPHGTGLVTIIHPWESGMDNTPPWMVMLRKHASSSKLRLLSSFGLIRFIGLFRKDTKFIPAEERMTTRDLFAVYDLIRGIRKARYDDREILKKQKVLVADLGYNSILVRATRYLAEIAEQTKQPLPKLTAKAHSAGTTVLEQLWDDKTKQYYSLDCVSGKLIKASSVATFLPLYAGKLPKNKSKALLGHLQNPLAYAASEPVPSAPLNSPYFKPHCYWQGPTWINMNWLIISGLRQNGYRDEAKRLRRSTLELVAKNGMNEYFSPIDGQPLGADNFSWTAALVLDLLHASNQ